MDSGTQLAVQRLAAEIVRLKKEVDVLKRGIRTTQLEGAVIDNGTISFADATGTIVHTIGVQPDGTVAGVSISTNPPQQPSAPEVAAIPNGLLITWDGYTADTSVWPSDFSAIQVFVSTTNGFAPNNTNVVGTLTTAGGITVSGLTIGTTYYVLFAAINTSGVLSVPSAQVSGVPIGAILAAGAVTQASLAAGLALAGALTTNPYFAGGDTTGWFAFRGTLTTTQAPPGTPPNPGGWVAQFTNTDFDGAIEEVGGYYFPAIPNQPYFISVWVNAPLGTNNVQIGFDWLLNGTYVSTGAVNLSGTGAWQQYTATITAPASGINQGNARVGFAATVGAGSTLYAWGILALAQLPGGLLQAGTVTATQIAAQTITAALIAANTITASQIAANTITATQIAAATITAAQIAAHSLTADVLGSQPASLNYNSFFSGGSATGWTASFPLGATTTPPAGGPPDQIWALTMTATGGVAANFGTDSGSKLFSVKPSTQYRITGWLYNTGAQGSVTLGSNNYLAGVYQNSLNYASINLPQNTWTFVDQVITTPVGLDAMGIYFAWAANGTTAYTVYGQAIQVFPQVPGTLIQAGSITTNQIAANTITAANILAGSLNATIIGNLGACLNANPFFAGGSTSGWFVSGTGNTITPVSGASIPGTAPYGNGTTNWAVQFVATAGGAGNKFSNGNAPFGLQLGNRYTATAWVYSSTAQSVSVGFEWRNAGTLVSTSSTANAIAANTWTLITGVATAPSSGVTTGNVVISAGAASTIYIQAAQAFPQIQGIVDATTITSSIINAGTFNGTDFVINSLGMFFYSGTPGLGNLVLSITPAAGANDGLGNAFKADFTVYDTGGGGQYIQVAAGNPPSVTVGDSVNTWKMDQSFTTSNTHTIGNTTGASNISDVMNIPANHAITGTHYIIEVPITGVFEGGVINIGMLVGVTYTNLVPTTASAFTTGHNFAGTIRFHLQVVLQGASGTANIWLEGTLSDASVNRSPTTTMSIDGIKTAIAFDTTIAQNFAMGWQWGSSITGQTVTGNNNTLTRRGA